MQLVAVLQARVVAFLQLEELNPRGRVFFPNITQGLLERYRFLKVPQTWEEYFNPPQGSGVPYLNGEWNGISIKRLEIFPSGIVVETQSSTDDSEKFLHEALAWAADTFDLTYQPSMIKRWAFVSHLTFVSEAPLLDALHPKLSSFEERITKSLETNLGLTIPFKAYGLSFAFETTGENPPAIPLQIERRGGVPFSENKYFSAAPLSTNEHLEFLKDFEAVILQSHGRS